MNTLIESSATEDLSSGRLLAIPIAVNNHHLVVHERRMTGAEIKAAAIAAGVQIQPTFTLMLKHHGRPSEVIGDSEVLVMKPGQRFSCLPADDNS